MNKIVPWSEREYEMLRELYPIMRAADVAKIIGRTMHAVEHKACALKLGKDADAFYKIRSESCRGENSGNFKNYRRKTTKGYIALYKPGHPNADKNGLVMEHRFIMSEHIGRPIRDDEAVHHINGNKKDNRLENLLLMDLGEHSAYHNRKRAEKCKKSS